MGKEDKCYLLVSNDKLQLPLCTADTPSDLARQTGLSYKTILRSLHQQRGIRLPKGRFTADYGLVIEVDLKEE